MLVLDPELEQPIPNCWKFTIEGIVKMIASKELKNCNFGPHRVAVSERDLYFIYDSLDSFGKDLIELPPRTWDTSICRWMVGSWALYVDLFVKDYDDPSDLVLHLNYVESKNNTFHVLSVHVP